MEKHCQRGSVENVIGFMKQNFECAICLQLMLNPVGTSCGHKFCRHCLLQTIGKRVKAPCPLCNVLFTKRSLQPMERLNAMVSVVRDLVDGYEADIIQQAVTSSPVKQRAESVVQRKMTRVEQESAVITNCEQPTKSIEPKAASKPAESKQKGRRKCATVRMAKRKTIDIKYDESLDSEDSKQATEKKIPQETYDKVDDKMETDKSTAFTNDAHFGRTYRTRGKRPSDENDPNTIPKPSVARKKRKLNESGGATSKKDGNDADKILKSKKSVVEEILEDFEVTANSECSSNTKMKVTSWFEGIQSPSSVSSTLRDSHSSITVEKTKEETLPKSIDTKKEANEIQTVVRNSRLRTRKSISSDTSKVTDKRVATRKTTGDNNQLNNRKVRHPVKFSYLDTLCSDESSTSDDESAITSITTNSVISRQSRASTRNAKKPKDLTSAIQMINSTRAKSKHRHPLERNPTSHLKDSSKIQAKRDAEMEFECEPYEMFVSQQVKQKPTKRTGRHAPKHSESLNETLPDRNQSDIRSDKRSTRSRNKAELTHDKRHVNSVQEGAQSCVVPTVEDVPINSKKSQERHELVEKIEEAEEFDLLFTQQANYGNDDENEKHPDLMNDVSVLDILDTVNQEPISPSKPKRVSLSKKRTKTKAQTTSRGRSDGGLEKSVEIGRMDGEGNRDTGGVQHKKRAGKKENISHGKCASTDVRKPSTVKNKQMVEPQNDGVEEFRLPQKPSGRRTRSSSRFSACKLTTSQIDVPCRNLPNSQGKNWSPARHMIEDFGHAHSTKNPVVIKGKKRSARKRSRHTEDNTHMDPVMYNDSIQRIVVAEVHNTQSGGERYNNIEPDLVACVPDTDTDMITPAGTQDQQNSNTTLEHSQSIPTSSHKKAGSSIKVIPPSNQNASYVGTQAFSLSSQLAHCLKNASPLNKDTKKNAQSEVVSQDKLNSNNSNQSLQISNNQLINDNGTEEDNEGDDDYPSDNDSDNDRHDENDSSDDVNSNDDEVKICTKTVPKHDLSEHENSMSDSLSGSDFCKIMDQNQRLEKPGIENDQCRTREKPTTGHDKCHTWDKSTEYDSVEDMSDESLLPDLDDSNLVEDANVEECQDKPHSQHPPLQTVPQTIPQSEGLFSEESELLIQKRKISSHDRSQTSAEVSVNIAKMSPVPEGSEIPDIQHSEAYCDKDNYCELQGNSIEEAMKMIEDCDMICADVSDNLAGQKGTKAEDNNAEETVKLAQTRKPANKLESLNIASLIPGDSYEPSQDSVSLISTSDNETNQKTPCKLSSKLSSIDQARQSGSDSDVCSDVRGRSRRGGSQKSQRILRSSSTTTAGSAGDRRVTRGSNSSVHKPTLEEILSDEESFDIPSDLDLDALSGAGDIDDPSSVDTVSATVSTQSERLLKTVLKKSQNSKSLKNKNSEHQDKKAKTSDVIAIKPEPTTCDICLAYQECDCIKIPRALSTSTSQPVVIEDRDFNSTQEMNKVLANIAKDMAVLDQSKHDVSLTKAVNIESDDEYEEIPVAKKRKSLRLITDSEDVQDDASLTNADDIESDDEYEEIPIAKKRKSQRLITDSEDVQADSELSPLLNINSSSLSTQSENFNTQHMNKLQKEHTELEKQIKDLESAMRKSKVDLDEITEVPESSDVSQKYKTTLSGLRSSDFDDSFDDVMINTEVTTKSTNDEFTKEVPLVDSVPNSPKAIPDSLPIICTPQQTSVNKGTPPHVFEDLAMPCQSPENLGTPKQPSTNTGSLPSTSTPRQSSRVGPSGSGFQDDSDICGLSQIPDTREQLGSVKKTKSYSNTKNSTHKQRSKLPTQSDNSGLELFDDLMSNHSNNIRNQSPLRTLSTNQMLSDRVIKVEKKSSQEKKLEYVPLEMVSKGSHDTCSSDWLGKDTPSATPTHTTLPKKLLNRSKASPAASKFLTTPVASATGHTDKKISTFFSPKSTSNRTHKEKLFTAHRLSAGGSAPSPAAEPEAFPRRTDWSITMSGINVPAVRHAIQTFAQKLGCQLTSTFTPQTTHVLVAKDMNAASKLWCKRTMKYFQAIAGKCWVLLSDWAVHSIEKGTLLDEDSYEVEGDASVGDKHGVWRSRTASIPVLHDYQIHCIDKFIDMSEEQLLSLLRELGASVIENPSDFKPSRKIKCVLLADAANRDLDVEVAYNLGTIYNATVLDKDWLLNTISAYEVQPFKLHDLCKAVLEAAQEAQGS